MYRINYCLQVSCKMTEKLCVDLKKNVNSRSISISICSTRVTRPPLPLAQTRESLSSPKLTTTTMTLHGSSFWWIINLPVVVLILLNYPIFEGNFSTGRWTGTFNTGLPGAHVYQVVALNENDEPSEPVSKNVIQEFDSFPDSKLQRPGFR